MWFNSKDDGTSIQCHSTPKPMVRVDNATKLQRRWLEYTMLPDWQRQSFEYTMWLEYTLPLNCKGDGLSRQCHSTQKTTARINNVNFEEHGSSIQCHSLQRRWLEYTMSLNFQDNGLSVQCHSTGKDNGSSIQCGSTPKTMVRVDNATKLQRQ